MKFARRIKAEKSVKQLDFKERVSDISVEIRHDRIHGYRVLRLAFPSLPAVFPVSIST
jgi:hypothetical protein